MPVSVLFGTFIALLVLTWITVYAVNFQLGPLNIWVAMIIATIKAALVCAYFMHLRFDKPFNILVLVGSVLFVVLFIGFAMTDTVEYRDEVNWQQVTLRPRE